MWSNAPFPNAQPRKPRHREPVLERCQMELHSLSFVKHYGQSTQCAHFTKAHYSASNCKYRQKLLYFEIISDSFSKKNTTKADIEHFFTQKRHTPTAIKQADIIRHPLNKN